MNKRAFTLVEMVVAVALIAMMIAFSSVIFKFGIGAQRAGNAQAEIMLKLRTITQQLNADFKGLRKDAPMMIWFEYDPNSGKRFDQMLFFADGDFHATQYQISSNVARIYYGQADMNDVNDSISYDNAGIFSRNQHVLAYDYIPYWPVIDTLPNFTLSFTPYDNINYEHDSISLAQWKMITHDPNYNDVLVNTCFGFRPKIDLKGRQKSGLHMLLSQNITNFAVRWGYAYLDTTVVPSKYRYLWYPRYDQPGITGLEVPGFDFTNMQNAYPALADPMFGVYFNYPITGNPVTWIDWFTPDEAVGLYIPPPDPDPAAYTQDFFPAALKFTFTIEDPRGVIDPQTFTHIVYLDGGA